MTRTTSSSHNNDHTYHTTRPTHRNPRTAKPGNAAQSDYGPTAIVLGQDTYNQSTTNADVSEDRPINNLSQSINVAAIHGGFSPKNLIGKLNSILNSKFDQAN